MKVMIQQRSRKSFLINDILTKKLCTSNVASDSDDDSAPIRSSPDDQSTSNTRMGAPLQTARRPELWISPEPIIVGNASNTSNNEICITSPVTFPRATTLNMLRLGRSTQDFVDRCENPDTINSTRHIDSIPATDLANARAKFNPIISRSSLHHLQLHASRLVQSLTGQVVTSDKLPGPLFPSQLTTKHLLAQLPVRPSPLPCLSRCLCTTPGCDGWSRHDCGSEAPLSAAARPALPVPLPFYVRTREADAGDQALRGRRCRRSRTVFTELQLMGLERRFSSQKYLSTPDRVELAEHLGLTQIQVKTWYQNRRMKWKKQVLDDGGTEPPTKPKGRPRKDANYEEHSPEGACKKAPSTMSQSAQE